MSSFDERKKGFEKKFAHDQELQFKVSARRNKYIGQWASKILGYDEEKEKEAILKATAALKHSGKINYSAALSELKESTTKLAILKELMQRRKH